MRFAQKYNTSSTRLNNWNYSTPGFYFITICTHQHNNFFGSIIDSKLKLKNIGKVCSRYLQSIPQHFIKTELLSWVVMPNHVHFLIHLVGPDALDKSLSSRNLPVETHDRASLHDSRKIILIKYSHKNHPDFFSRMSKKSHQDVPNIISQFKSSVKRYANENNIFFSWQVSFFDEIITDNKRLQETISYINNNIKNWQKDKYFSSHAQKN